MQEQGAEAVILGTKVPVDVASNFGCIVSDPETQQVRHYVEKPESHISSLINCGVYLFSSSIFKSIRAAMTSKAERLASDPYLGESDDSSELLRLEQDILGPLSETGNFYVYETKGFWRQIKTAGSAVPANALYLQQAWQSNSSAPGLAQPSANIVAPVYIHPTAHVDPTAKLGPNVSIGPRAVVAAGARVKDSIVLEDAEIKHDACVLWSIIGWNSKVGAWARVEGSPTAVGTHNTTVVKNGVKVQSVSILSKDCVVHDEVRVQNCVCLPLKELKKVSSPPPTIFPVLSTNTPNRTSPTKSSCKLQPQRVQRWEIFFFFFFFTSFMKDNDKPWGDLVTIY